MAMPVPEANADRGLMGKSLARRDALCLSASSFRHLRVSSELEISSARPSVTQQAHGADGLDMWEETRRSRRCDDLDGAWTVRPRGCVLLRRSGRPPGYRASPNTGTNVTRPSGSGTG
jgi:hypothetical protein